MDELREMRKEMDELRKEMDELRKMRKEMRKETLSDDFWGDVPRLLCQWETPLLGAFAPQEMLPFPFFFYTGHYS